MAHEKTGNPFEDRDTEYTMPAGKSRRKRVAQVLKGRAKGKTKKGKRAVKKVIIK